MKKQFRKTLLLCLSFVLVAAVAIAGTVAYLTDTDSKTNVMTVGSVHIEQHEYERVVDANGNYATDTIDGQTSYVLKDFTQAKPLLPSAIDTTTWEGWDWDSTVVRMTQVDSYGGMQVFKAASNAQDKFVTVENTGDTDAYIRTLVAIEIGSTDGSLIGTSYHSTWTDTDFDPSTTKVSDPLYIQIDGKNYMLQEYIYAGGQLSDGSWRHGNGILPAGDTSYPNLSQVYIKSAATNEDMKALDGNGNGTLDILVLSQAVQAKGFSDAKTALDTAFGDITTTNHPWAEGVNIPAAVNTTDELIEALNNNENVVLTSNITVAKADAGSNAYGATGINILNGQTFDGNGKAFGANVWTTWDSAISTTGGTIKNVTINKGMRGIFVNHNSSFSEKVYLDNVIIDGTVYTISCDQGTNKGLEAKNSTFNGWTSYAATIGDVKFENCSFGEGQGYAFARPYAPTKFVGCNFEEGYEIDARAVVSFENCTINGTPLTSANLSTLVTGNIQNATVK